MKYNVHVIYVNKMDISLLLIFFIVFILSFYLLRRKQNLPPGPLSLPILGSLFFLNDLRKFRPHQVFKNAAKKYGDVMSFSIGSQRVVSLYGFDVVHEALVKQADVFSGRPTNVRLVKRAFEEDNGKPRGILLNDHGPTWRHMRRFTLQVLRDFGVGKTSIEDKILTEIDATSAQLERLEGEPINVNVHLQNIIFNVIYGIVFGRRYDYDDTEFQDVARMTRTAVSGEGQTSIGNFLPPSLVRIISKEQFERDNAVIDSFREMRKYVLEQISDHEATFDKNNIRDFIDLYLKTLDDGSVKDKEGIEKEEMFRVIMDLFLAGSETTSTSLDWAILYMTEYPIVQMKCQEEIREVFGDKTILYADRGKVPYVEATLLEIQRMATIVPSNVPHYTHADTTLRGYFIPKGTLVIPSIYGASFDPRHWENPDKFRPGRFLDGQGKLIKKEAMIPFSTGPRQCLGEPLARMELFSVFANLLQKFTFEPENKNVKHSFESVAHQVTNSPMPYNCRVTRRK